MNTGTHWTQDEIDDDKDYQIEVLEKRLLRIERSVKVVIEADLEGNPVAELIQEQLREVLGGDSNE